LNYYRFAILLHVHSHVLKTIPELTTLTNYLGIIALGQLTVYGMSGWMLAQFIIVYGKQLIGAMP
jgi:hypothetical protein